MLGLTIDPGKESGICLFQFGHDRPMEIIEVWQFRNGAEGLAAFLDWKDVYVGTGRGMTDLMWFETLRLDVLVVEKFTPRDDPDFKLTRDSVEPLRGEGVLIGRGFAPFIQWQEPSMQYFMGPSTNPLPVKKKLSREFLKLHGMLPTPKQVGRPDANDAISATLHTVAWARRVRHMPTIEALFPQGQ